MSALEFDLGVIRPLQEELNRHPVYNALRDVDDLRLFMGHHIYSVWDFMSLIKSLQAGLAPTRVPWSPVGDPAVRRFINELVLEEESDQGLPDSELDPTLNFLSHFELYCLAMAEIGADPEPAKHFVTIAADGGIAPALASGIAPPAAADFINTTFSFIDSGRLHTVAAALALGREHIIPAMFRTFLRDMGITAEQAPAFHFYLNRHIHLDEDFHGPLSLRMLNHLCGGQRDRLAEAEDAAQAALRARIAFWDGVDELLQAR